MSARIETLRNVAAGALLLASAAGAAPHASALTFSLEGVSGWPNQAHYDAAVAAASSAIDRYNSYGNFNNVNSHIYIYYEPGIPTAQANFGGSVGFGGTYPNERVMMHEFAHFLGLPSGNWNALISGGWSGAQGAALIKQFEGEQATINGDGAHFWPYGLNFDSEGSEINKQRQVAMVYAMRADLGIGPSAHPATATQVNLTASDPSNTSSFNHKDNWSDGYFAHANADYYTNGYTMQTPQSSNNFTFAGKSLTISNGPFSTGFLYYKGEGASTVTTFNDLILDGGWIDHRSGTGSVFQLDGNLTVASNSNIRAKQDDIHVLADVAGSGKLTIQPADSPAEDDRYVRFFSPNNSYTGTLENHSRFELAQNAGFKFAIQGFGTANAITGDDALATALNGVFHIDTTGLFPSPGQTWDLVTAANVQYGSTFQVQAYTRDTAGPGQGVWTNDIGFSFSEATGTLAYLAQLLGDYNGSGQVEQGDLDLVLQNWGVDTDTAGVPSGWVASPPQGQIEQTELDAVLQNWGSTQSPNFRGTNVPEPAAAGLLLAALTATRLRKTAGR